MACDKRAVFIKSESSVFGSQIRRVLFESDMEENGCFDKSARCRSKKITTTTTTITTIKGGSDLTGRVSNDSTPVRIEKREVISERSSSAAVPKEESASIGVPVECQKSEGFALECLEAHNERRARHGVPPLALSEEMCEYSREWAEKLAAENKFEHRSGNKYGENIFSKWSSNPQFKTSGKDAVDSWYSEIKDYEFGREPTHSKAGHFSQVVWKGSRQLGVACAKSKDGRRVVVVANYDPPGNFRGRYVENVPPTLKN